MKTNFNDCAKRFNKKSKEVIFHKKINISTKLSNYNTYISSSLPKTNKTLKKYINDKLNIMKKKSNYNLYQEQNPKSISKIKTILIYKNEDNFLNTKNNQKPKNILLKQRNINSQIYSKKSISKSKFNYVNTLNKSTDNNKSFTCLLRRKQSKKQLKLINSVSTSAGMSSSSNKIDENGRFTFHDYHINNNNCINTLDTNNNIIYDKKSSKRCFYEESNYCKPKINNFNYETGSDDNLNENIIFLKNDNNSSLTFGNSFTYSNSQRSKSTKKDKNVDNINNQLSLYNNNNNNYLTKLKEENETLKKELKESNDQISFLKYKIKKLKEDNSNNTSKNNSRNNSRNIIFPPNIWNKKFIKYELLQKNIFKNIKEFSLDNGMSERTKFKKEFIQKLNNTINDNNLYTDNRQKINVKRNLNLKKKIIKKSINGFSSFCLDKPCEKITECISNLKI